MHTGKKSAKERTKMRFTKIIAAFLALMMLAIPAAAPADPAEQPEEIIVPVFDSIKQQPVPENEATALMREMKIGWNLGNTFDAYDGYYRVMKGAGMETSWCRAKTTKELFAAIKEAGFKSIRIPVSWHNHADGNYVIDAEWMGRVKEVVGWALDLDFYVVINVHHDNDVSYFYPDSEHYEQSAAYLTAVWQQMADTFNEFGDHLIFESLNEPRLVGTPYEWSWDKSAPECQDAADCINRLNQLFVDTIRATGGNNARRFLAVPAYCGAPWNAVDEAFQLPKDTVENRLIVETHAYSPYDFALNLNSDDHVFDAKKTLQKKNEILGLMRSLYNRFVSKGIPVMMDEFGALEKQGNTQDRVNYAAYYTACAGSYGIMCFWWDNHIFTGTGERFGLINRNTLEWTYPEIAEALVANGMINR